MVRSFFRSRSAPEPRASPNSSPIALKCEECSIEPPVRRKTALRRMRLRIDTKSAVRSATAS